MVRFWNILGVLFDWCVLLVTTRTCDVSIGNWRVIVGFPVPTAGWKVAVHACEPHCGTGDEVLWRVFEGVARQQGGQLGVMSTGLKSCLLSVPGPDKNRQAGLGQPAWSCHHGHLLTAIITSTPTSHQYSIQTQLRAPHVPLQPAITNTPAVLTRLPFFPLNESLINIVGSGDAGLYGAAERGWDSARVISLNTGLFPAPCASLPPAEIAFFCLFISNFLWLVTCHGDTQSPPVKARLAAPMIIWFQSSDQSWFWQASTFLSAPVLPFLLLFLSSSISARAPDLQKHT